MKIDTKKWFPVPDSELMDQDDEPTGIFNIEARFTDHPILNVEKSRAARHNVYDQGPCLHMRVLHNSDGDPVQIKNSTSHVMRFDKGEDTRVASQKPGPAGNPVLHYDGSPGMGKEEFEAAIRDIVRCWAAWQHYQKFREAPVTPLEARAMELIAQMPSAQTPGVIMVDVGGKLQARKIDQDDEEEEDNRPRRRPTPKKRKAA